MAWTDDRVEVLSKLWAEGLSASQIAKQLGGVTRNAVGEYATILTLSEHMCKWPIGDPSKSDFRFCGRKTDPTTPYCEAHSSVAYQPSRRRYPGQKSLEEQKRRLLSQKLSGQK